MIKQQIQPWNVLSTQVLDSLALVKARALYARRQAQPGLHRDSDADQQGQCMLEPRLKPASSGARNERKRACWKSAAGPGYMAALLAATPNGCARWRFDTDLARGTGGQS
ncbi:MAG: hypothetical protein IPL70_19330 [Uliginosibacterium sp.]|nr:hypothetical protein [Uliginosibacterium sp.]